jgi:glycosyltransferase involved in cell wall biosynthesis
MPSPLVSVIIPCYGYAHLVAAAVASVRAQTYGNVEAIVIDDGSPDDTATAVGQFGSFVRYIRQPNAGPAAARNTGLRAMRGDLAIFLDADDRLAETMVQHMVDAAEQHPDASVFAGAWHDMDAAGRLICAHAAPAFGRDPLHALLPTNLAPPVCYMFRCDALRRAGGFDPDRALSGHEDWELLLRLAAGGARFVTVPRASAYYRVSPTSLSADRRRMYWSGRAVLQRAFAVLHHCPECRRRLAWSRRGFAGMYLGEVLAPTVRRSRTPRDLADAWARFADDLQRDPALGRLIAECVLKRLRPDFVLGRLARRLGMAPARPAQPARPSSSLPSIQPAPAAERTHAAR